MFNDALLTAQVIALMKHIAFNQPYHLSQLFANVTTDVVIALSSSLLTVTHAVQCQDAVSSAVCECVDTEC